MLWQTLVIIKVNNVDRRQKRQSDLKEESCAGTKEACDLLTITRHRQRDKQQCFMMIMFYSYCSQQTSLKDDHYSDTKEPSDIQAISRHSQKD